MGHLSEWELAEYAFDPESIDNRRELETHVNDCPQCSSRLTFIQTVEVGLHDPEVWKGFKRNDPARREALKDLAVRTATEDAEAEELLEDLIENPAKMAWTKLAADRRYRTAGVVRGFVRRRRPIRELPWTR